MRQIKFRAWDKKKKEMLKLSIERISSYEFSFFYPDGIIMQFTGLKDKNNPLQEVYEYDIIDKDGKVIGNKYETPALLKDPTNLLIQGFGTEDWQTTNAEAMARGCKYTK